MNNSSNAIRGKARKRMSKRQGIQLLRQPDRNPSDSSLYAARFRHGKQSLHPSHLERAQGGGTFKDSNAPCFRRPVILPPARSQGVSSPACEMTDSNDKFRR